MCGIVGILNLTKDQWIDESKLRQMLAMIRHRGPDQFGIYLDNQVGLGSARLSIIDLDGGQQPISNEDHTLWIVVNGEIFNYLELKSELDSRGHHFSTQTDTEVILHLYEDCGPECLRLLNGQFAIAIWNSREKSLFLARDRLGIRPLYYTQLDGAIIFGSEIKAILADPRVQPKIDLIALDQIFTYWSTLPPRSIFEEIFEIPPGHYCLAQDGEIRINRYWQLSFPTIYDMSEDRQPSIKVALTEYIEEFRNLLVDATRIRLRADVPVGAYLSGGLDSSTTAAIIRNYTGSHLDTFSISFSDPQFDESKYQLKMARFLGTDHHAVHATHAEIGRVFPEVTWHTEVPILRTSPAPLFLLSRLVRNYQYKVVLTGEGADEFLAGYDIFKEAKIRRFWSRQPESHLRPLLLKRLYPDIVALSGISGSYLANFFGQGLEDVDAPDYSHAIRWRNTCRTKRFFSKDVRQNLSNRNSSDLLLDYPPDFNNWDPLHRAQYLEASIFLPQYLLSSQGDRVAMAHSVEGRFPFLDHRVVEFSNNLPADIKLRGLNEKYILKKLAQKWLPEEICQRPKRPYRAPIQRSFFGQLDLDYVNELLSSDVIRRTGFFNPEAVSQLINKAKSSSRLSETDEMALVGILSSQLIYHQFFADFRLPTQLCRDEVKIFSRQHVSKERWDEI